MRNKLPFDFDFTSYTKKTFVYFTFDFANTSVVYFLQ